MNPTASDNKQRNRDKAKQFLHEFIKLCDKYDTQWDNDEGGWLEFSATKPGGVAIMALDRDDVLIGMGDSWESVWDFWKETDK